MLSYAETIAGNQPDDTQGIAKVGLIDGSTNKIVELVGCVIHLSKKDESLRNILKVETNIEMEYFIFVPWFHSCRREVNENSTKIEVKLHRYKKEQGKKFSVDKDNSKTIFENYHSDNYFVIPCPELKEFQKSSFLKKWSSNLLLHNNSSQIYKGEKSFYGFRKDGGLFKFFGLKKDINKLEEQGVLLEIRPSNESYVIGCYKKLEDGEIKMYCFLLKGLEEIAEPARGTDNPPPDQPSSGRIEEERDNPPLQHPPSGRIEGRMDIPTLEQSPAGRIEEERGNPPLQHPPSGRIEGRTDNPTLEQSPSGRIEEERDNPPLQQPTSGRIEGRTDNSQESEDGPIGSKLVLVSGRHTSRPMNPEEERAKTEKKELIHKTYGPKVEDMPHDVTHEVCLMLNPIQKIKANDYRKVADNIGLKRVEIKNIGSMDDVFDVMITQAKKVDEFVDILFKIGREDVVSMMYEMATHKQS
ncbi:uncharacterized protein LOC116300799 isoform X3 [Actinia tenebrosa]|uniref:Uncharacterized protein LOC116300799 isoform X2 n=1 Tax=Actinia tenebrosa TaxID=6105 RepID=A0A6P8IFU8_ACTTE|nr:uncharacterized protein LOC116300799 isoform X2 [Actinia tenebrosa]XP_031565601.1 uncharacterized protein LOC116300799 isoform X3 [Actinia tenebrosa]